MEGGRPVLDGHLDFVIDDQGFKDRFPAADTGLTTESHFRPRRTEFHPANHPGSIPSRTSRPSEGSDSSMADRGQSFLTNRCEMASFKLSATIKGCGRNKNNRLGTSQAELVCSVEIARCPEEDNRMKASTLSSSRISPIITMLYAQSEQRKRTEVYKSRVNERAGKTTTFLNRHEIQLHGTSNKNLDYDDALQRALS